MFFIQHNLKPQVFGQVWGLYMEEKLFLEIKQYSRDILNGKTIEGEGESDFTLQGVKQAGVGDDNLLIKVPAELCTFIGHIYPSQLADDVAEMLRNINITPQELQIINEFPSYLLREIEKKYNELTSEPN